MQSETARSRKAIRYAGKSIVRLLWNRLEYFQVDSLCCTWNHRWNRNVESDSLHSLTLVWSLKSWIAWPRFRWSDTRTRFGRESNGWMIGCSDFAGNVTCWIGQYRRARKWVTRAWYSRFGMKRHTRLWEWSDSLQNATLSCSSFSSTFIFTPTKL